MEENCMVRPVTRDVDLMHLGRDRVICAYDLDGVIVDPGPASCVETLLARCEPRVLLLTHIHLDHAGATGVIVRRFPDVPVYVHERGAPHLVDPSKLLASASQLYGEDMERMWGEVLPVPEANVQPLAGGETVAGFRVGYTPGHASHHVCYLHEETGHAYVGDMAGVRIPPSEATVAPTPPPDIDLEAWRESLELISGWDPSALCLTHFGRFADVEAQLGSVREALARQAEWARRGNEASFGRAVREEVLAGADADTASSLFQAAPPDQLFLGLQRYLAKRGEKVEAR
jgi:glyoxylase-like metal-dependent hydrolase (beta-lactamase superfamily II)